MILIFFLNTYHKNFKLKLLNTNKKQLPQHIKHNKKRLNVALTTHSKKITNSLYSKYIFRPKICLLGFASRNIFLMATHFSVISGEGWEYVSYIHIPTHYRSIVKGC